MIKLKKSLLLLLYCFLSSQVYADSVSVFQNGYGSLVMKRTSVQERINTVFGFRSGWILNRSVIVGVGIYGMIDKIDVSNDEGGNIIESKINFGYGGFEAEYIRKLNKRYHFTIHSLFGIGALSYDGVGGLLFRSKNDDYYENFYDSNFYKNMGYPNAENDWLVVFEPSFNVGITVAETLRIVAGLSYRAVAGVELKGLDNSDISGPGVSVVITFGR